MFDRLKHIYMSDKMGRRTQSESRLVPLCPTDEMLMSFLKYFLYFLYFVTVLNHFPQCYLNLKKNLETAKQRMDSFGTSRYVQYLKMSRPLFTCIILII